MRVEVLLRPNMCEISLRGVWEVVVQGVVNSQGWCCGSGWGGISVVWLFGYSVEILGWFRREIGR